MLGLLMPDFAGWRLSSYRPGLRDSLLELLGLKRALRKL
jgi:hypothetical protein